ncbi:carbamoyl phosphate synthase small subunit [Metabacillus herbersteinensis]|uniref:Carbamoyl phosphate synthase small chain n=1 Tax=Metabacillus herbersteinensis TaxID=283816 RepID=A0ABV6GGG1_9BACI
MKGYLHLENGSSFEGEIDLGSDFKVTGEIVFFTGMTGYQEVLTDPSYQNQIVVFTFPLIGNYGINESDNESIRPQIKGAVFYECCSAYSHYEAKSSLKEYLKKWGIPFIEHVDTRAVVKQIRESGSMKAEFSTSKEKTTQHLIQEDIYQVSSDAIETYGQGKTHLVLVDFGYKKSIVTCLTKRGCRVTIVPIDNIDRIAQMQPDGIILSNGPGNPERYTYALSKINRVITKYPTLGICLGHQLVALSFGAKTKKLHFGHRGANHPVTDLKTNQVFITSQNHSYEVIANSLKPTDLIVRFSHINDESVEGVCHKTYPILTTQFHPEAHPGPTESEWIFDEFLNLVAVSKGDMLYA